MKRLLMLSLLAVALGGCAAGPSEVSGETRIDARVVAQLPGGREPRWSPAGGRLLYLCPDGRASTITMDHPNQPQLVTMTSTHSLGFSSGGQDLAYICSHAGPQRPESTVCVQPLQNAPPVDLFEGVSIIHGVSGSLFIERWLDSYTLAYSEHMGTGARELRLVDIPSRKHLLPVSSDYAATRFTWTVDGARVAGQREGGPRSFWLWDRKRGEFLKPKGPLPGAQQVFEAWSPDGGSLLFTAWDGGFPYLDKTARPTLYRWSLQDGQIEKVVENAGRAVWAGAHIAYVRQGELVVTGPGGWSQALGLSGPSQWPQPPSVQGDYIAFADAQGQWFASPIAAKAPRPLAKGSDLKIVWSPDTRHLAVQGGEHLWILANPANPNP